MAGFSDGFVPVPTPKPTQSGVGDSIGDWILTGLRQWWEYDSLETRLALEAEYNERQRLGNIANNPAGTVSAGLLGGIGSNGLLMVGALAVGGLLLIKGMK